MNLKRNILANYASQLYVTAVGIVMLPLYIQYMGIEAYGLIGFFALLQAWFSLLDIGLTPTMLRETARFNGGAIDAIGLRRMLRVMEGIFILIAFLGGIAMAIGSDFIATHWLKLHNLPVGEVQNAIKVMAVIIALRWISGLYRAAICGFERLVWLGGFNIAIASARFVLVIPFFIYGFTSPTQFFCYQLVLALFEVIFLVIKTYRLLPPPGAINHTPWQWTPLRGMLKFSLSIAFTGSVWVLVTQTDKLVLSKLLPLSEYAYFTMAVLVAGGVSLISGPASGALLPRLAKLAAEGDEVGMIRLYRNATQLVGVIAIPAALMLAFFAEQVLWAWTGSVDIALKASPVLTLYALGNGILALGAFPYYLQFAKGDLRLHMIGNAVFVLVLIPALIWATEKYGGEGAGYVWLGLNIFLFVAWSPIVHHKFAPGLNLKWYKEDVLVILIPTLAVGFCFSLSDFNHLSSSRLMQFIKIILIGLVLLMTSIVASSVVREKLKKYLNLLLVKIKWQKQ